MIRLAIPRLAAVLCLAVCVGAVRADQWTGNPSPHDGKHVVPLRTGAFKSADGKAPAFQKLPGTSADGAFELAAPHQASLKIRQAGKYVFWLRVAPPAKGQSVVEVKLSQNGKAVLSGSVGERNAKPGIGGPAGYEQFALAAAKTGATGKFDKTGGDFDPDKGKTKKGADVDDFESELLEDLGEKPKKNTPVWIHADRLEEAKGERPFYWWQLGPVELEPGMATVELAPAATRGKTPPALIDLGCLTTAADLTYPYIGDLDAAPASYLRFRLDDVPPKGLTITAGLRIHSEPWSTGAVWLNPARMSVTKGEPHTQPGYTRWYRLQDIEYAPGFGAAEAHLNIQLAGHSGPVPAGATQFAVYPHEDYVLREIGWQEPDGLSLSLLTDFETYLHKLRTIRDHAREDYDRARVATGGRIFPLTQHPLYFGNAWGAAGGEALDYMVQTLRLLGFNSVGQANDALAYRKLYGWTSHTGEYWPPVHMPFDEAASVKAYDAYYSDFFSRNKELYEGVSIFQLADEPGEISRPEMTSPLWRYVEKDKKAQWVDASGNSELATKRVDLQDCVLEGTITQHGTWIGFRVATDQPTDPTRFAYWSLGQISQNREFNVAVGRGGKKPSGEAAFARPGAVIGATPTEFKIVYSNKSAALYIKGKLVHQHADLPDRGGFAIVGPPKAISALKLRPMKKNEKLTSAEDDDVASKDDKKNDLEEDVADLLADDKDLPDWAKPKTLDKFVKEDWVAGGGIPGAHEAFRKWAAEQGLEPDLFGAKAWDDVRMLTVPELVTSPSEARLFYWSRKFSGYLTPKMFALSADAIRRHAPNPEMQNFVALSGHALYFPSTLPLDMFQLANGSPAMMPGISDWMSYGGWRWDSHQAVAYSVAMYNAGARRPGAAPASFPMMHCVWPSDFRSYTMLANQVKYISFYNFGPSYAVTEGHWNDADGSYVAVHNTANRAAQVDDILATATARPSRVALLYSMSNEYWNPTASFADKRALFLGLSHEGYQPELVNEDQVVAGQLENYDALFVVEPILSRETGAKIADWVRGGGLLVATADAGTADEYREPHDFVAELAGVQRTFAPPAKPAEGAAPAKPAPAAPAPQMQPVKSGDFRPHAVATSGVPATIKTPASAKLRGQYADKRPAWVETAVGKGRVHYFGHRLGLTYTQLAVRRGGFEAAWADTGRASFIAPLREQKVARELVVSEPVVLATPMTNARGTVVILYNMRPVPLRDVQLTLKEKTKPLSVEMFEGHDLQPLPFEFADGAVTITLPELTGGQMVVVRHKTREKDDRLDKMHAQTLAELASDDPRALAAGAFFAGAFPEWKLADKLLPLLDHDAWHVRRSAAEALGKLPLDAGSTATLAKKLADEPDSHVLAEGLLALGRLPSAPAETLVEVVTRGLDHNDAYVRRAALRATSNWLARDNPPAALRDLAEERLTAVLADPDLRVRSAAIELLAVVDPTQLAQSAAEAFAAPTKDALALPVWAETLAKHEVAFKVWLAAKLPGGPDLVRSVAAHRAAPELSTALAAQTKSLTPETQWAFLSAAIRQRDAKLTKSVFTARESLPPALQSYVPLLLEFTFDARLGDVLADWDAYLKTNESRASRN